MGLEITGSRVLAPYFGNSIFVWGSLISVFMASLSAGYVLGGRLSDRSPSFVFMAWPIGIAALFVLLLPQIAPVLCEALVDADLGPRLGPFLASLSLFFLPSLLLGMLSPFAVRLAATKLERVGNTAGELYALSTMGSIVGTLATSFYLIAQMGVRDILLLLGGLLAITAAVAFVVGFKQVRTAAKGRDAQREGRDAQPDGWRRQTVGISVLAVLAVLALIAGFAPARAVLDGGGTVLFERDTAYHHILVVDRGGQRHLKFDNSWQSGMLLDDPFTLAYTYTHYFHLGPIFQPEAQRALFVGLGGGSVPKNFRRDYPELSMDVAELDPQVIHVAKTYFGVKPDANLKLHAADGRLFIRSAAKENRRYDLAFLDAYYADSIPFHLTTVEFLKELKSALNSDAVVVSNIIGSLSGPHSKLFRSMLRSFQDVFPLTYVFPVGLFDGSANDGVLRNIILVATVNSSPLSLQALQGRAEELLNSGKMRDDVRVWLRSLVQEPIPVSDVPLLSDDYAPVDNLLAF